MGDVIKERVFEVIYNKIVCLQFLYCSEGYKENVENLLVNF